jgi:ferredoxin-NADP reductase
MRAMTATRPFRTVSRSVSAVLRSRFIAALSEPRGIDHYAELVAPTWSAREIRARIVGLRRETSDTVSLLLEPNQNWPGFRAGQHVELSVTLEGVRHTRIFSISSSPREGTPIRVTIRAFRGGRVSSWAFERARRGDVVVLGKPQGEFVMPRDLPPSLIFVSGGSGITPVASLTRELVRSGYRGDIACVHYARNEIIFQEELAWLAEDSSRFRFVPQLTGGAKPSPRLSRALLDSVQPTWRASDAFVCGPAALQRDFVEMWAAERLPNRQLHLERFTSYDTLAAPDDAACATTSPEMTPEVKPEITFARSGISVRGRAHASLLVQAESAGLAPAYGCRMGICRTCLCKKQSGIVRDAQTGTQSGDGSETIRLCVSTPVSDVVLDL